MNVFKACSPPSCSCPELELYQDIDGQDMAAVTDDLNRTAIMTEKEWDMLVTQYREAKPVVC
jgi:hypothetical protein